MPLVPIGHLSVQATAPVLQMVRLVHVRVVVDESRSRADLVFGRVVVEDGHEHVLGDLRPVLVVALERLVHVEHVGGRHVRGRHELRNLEDGSLPGTSVARHGGAARDGRLVYLHVRLGYRHRGRARGHLLLLVSVRRVAAAAAVHHRAQVLQAFVALRR